MWPVLQSFGEERICNAEQDGRWDIRRSSRIFFKLLIVDSEERPVIQAVLQRMDKTAVGEKMRSVHGLVTVGSKSEDTGDVIYLTSAWTT